MHSRIHHTTSFIQKCSKWAHYKQGREFVTLMVNGENIGLALVRAGLAHIRAVNTPTGKEPRPYTLPLHIIC